MKPQSDGIDKHPKKEASVMAQGQLIDNTVPLGNHTAKGSTATAAAEPAYAGQKDSCQFGLVNNLIVNGTKLKPGMKGDGTMVIQEFIQQAERFLNQVEPLGQQLGSLIHKTNQFAWQEVNLVLQDSRTILKTTASHLIADAVTIGSEAIAGTSQLTGQVLHELKGLGAQAEELGLSLFTSLWSTGHNPFRPKDRKTGQRSTTVIPITIQDN